jgi:hypothetical protein
VRETKGRAGGVEQSETGEAEVTNVGALFGDVHNKVIRVLIAERDSVYTLRGEFVNEDKTRIRFGVRRIFGVEVPVEECTILIRPLLECVKWRIDILGSS